MDRNRPSRVLAVGGIFDSIGDAISSAAEGAFNAVSKAVTTVARPVFNVARDAVSHVTHGIATLTPFLPSAIREKVHAAARVVARARLGDVTAKQFIRSIGQAAKAGIEGARRVGDALLDGARLVSRVVDVPTQLLGKVPLLGDLVRSVSPFQKFEHVASALQHGDWRALKDIVKGDLSMAQGVVSLVPGVGTGISAGISAGLAALEGGNPLEIALRTAYGALPIPVGIRSITDAVLASVLELISSGNITDALLVAARDKVPSGFPREVFDTLVQIIAKRVPIAKAATGLVSHYVSQYGGDLGKTLLTPVEKLVAPVEKLVSSPLEPLSHLVDPVGHLVSAAAPSSAVRARLPFLSFGVAGEADPSALSRRQTAALHSALPFRPELLAYLPHESEWRTLRALEGSGR